MCYSFQGKSRFYEFECGKYSEVGGSNLKKPCKDKENCCVRVFNAKL